VRTSYFASVLRNSWLCNCTEENSRALDVPEPVAKYLAAEEAKEADALSRCFTEDGTVHDEGQDYHGRDSIRQWKQAADAKYR
jgi:ketosteroid isomerase-like protein